MADSKNLFKTSLSILEELEKAGKKARLVGGCVRDRLQNLQPKDYDIATEALPREILAIFEKSPWKTVPTGIDHGTITVVTKFGPIEVTTLRKDLETDGRHAKVAFGTSFEEDAARRDFTINAMSEDKNGQVFDYYGGKEDLKAKILKFVGEPRVRIKEDYLRILRFFRFWARFQLIPDTKALDAIKENARNINSVSRERVTSEFLQTLDSDDCYLVLKGMESCGVLSALFGDYLAPMDKEKAALFKELWAKERALVRFCGLLTPFKEEKEVKRLAEKWRLSREQSQLLKVFLVFTKDLPKSQDDTAAKMAFLDQIEKTAATKRLEDLLAGMQWLCPQDKKMYESLLLLEATKGAVRRAPPLLNGKEVARETGLEGVLLGRALKELVRSHRNGDISDAIEARKFIKKYCLEKPKS